MSTPDKRTRISTICWFVLILGIASAHAEVIRLDADTAARLAVENSPLADQASANIEAVSGRAASADAERLPTVSLGARVSYRSEVPEFSAPIGGPGEPPTVIFPNIQNTYALSATVDQMIYSGGRITAGRRSSVMEVDAAGADRAGLLAFLRMRGRAAFWAAVAADAAVTAAESEVTRAQRLYDDSQALLEAGMAVKADRLAAEARHAGSKVRLIRAKADLETAFAELRSLLGLVPGTEIDLVRTGGVPPSPTPLPELLEEAHLRRPELGAARNRIESSTERQDIAAAGKKPSLMLTAGWDLARPNQRFMPMEDAWNDSWYVGLGATWTVFDGKRTASAEATAHAQTDALRADAREVARQVDLEVENARTNLESAIEAISAAEAARIAGIAREEAERDRYQAGMTPISNVLDAQAELAVAEQQVIDANAAAWTADAMLDRAVGR